MPDVYWPVTNGTSWVTLICASWLSSVVTDGVEMMLVLALPDTARSSAAKLVPFLLSLPTATVVPLGRLAPAPLVEVVDVEVDEPPARAATVLMTSPMPVPETAELKAAAGTFEPLA